MKLATEGRGLGAGEATALPGSLCGCPACFPLPAPRSKLRASQTVHGTMAASNTIAAATYRTGGARAVERLVAGGRRRDSIVAVAKPPGNSRVQDHVVDVHRPGFRIV